MKRIKNFLNTFQKIPWKKWIFFLNFHKYFYDNFLLCFFIFFVSKKLIFSFVFLFIYLINIQKFSIFSFFLIFLFFSLMNNSKTKKILKRLFSYSKDFSKIINMAKKKIFFLKMKIINSISLYWILKKELSVNKIMEDLFF